MGQLPPDRCTWARHTLNIWIKGWGVQIAMAFTTAPLLYKHDSHLHEAPDVYACRSPSNALVVLRPHQVEHMKQLRLVLLPFTVWRLQRQHRRDHVERRLIQEENGPVLQVLLGTIG